MNVRHLASRVEGSGVSLRPRTAPHPVPTGDSFAEALQRAQTPDLTLSAHAAERIEQRGIPLTQADLDSITDAMRHLDAKGARDALLLRSDTAFIVNVPNRTIVTALGQSDMKDRVFTGIDSALVL